MGANSRLEYFIVKAHQSHPVAGDFKSDQLYKKALLEESQNPINSSQMKKLMLAGMIMFAMVAMSFMPASKTVTMKYIEPRMIGSETFYVFLDEAGNEFVFAGALNYQFYKYDLKNTMLYHDFTFAVTYDPTSDPLMIEELVYVRGRAMGAEDEGEENEE